MALKSAFRPQEGEARRPEAAVTGDRRSEIEGLARSLRGVPVRTEARYLLAYR